MANLTAPAGARRPSAERCHGRGALGWFGPIQAEVVTPMRLFLATAVFVAAFALASCNRPAPAPVKTFPSFPHSFAAPEPVAPGSPPPTVPVVRQPKVQRVPKGHVAARRPAPSRAPPGLSDLVGKPPKPAKNPKPPPKARYAPPDFDNRPPARSPPPPVPTPGNPHPQTL